MIDRAPVGVGLRAAAFLIDWVLFAFMIAVVWIVSGGVNTSAENRLLRDPNTGLSLVITAAALVYFGGEGVQADLFQLRRQAIARNRRRAGGRVHRKSPDRGGAHPAPAPPDSG